MNTILKISGLSLVFLITLGCGQKAFLDERFTFSSKYRDFISPYHIGDTLNFEKKNGEVIRIKITGLDSSVVNSKGGFMSPRPYKTINVYCNNLDYHKVNAKDTTLVFINIYPDSLKQSCNFSLLNFRGDLDDETDSLILEFQPASNRVFKNCFVIKNIASDLVESPNDIEYVYVQQVAGIIALKSYNGDWWLKR